MIDEIQRKVICATKKWYFTNHQVTCPVCAEVKFHFGTKVALPLNLEYERTLTICYCCHHVWWTDEVLDDSEGNAIMLEYEEEHEEYGEEFPGFLKFLKSIKNPSVINLRKTVRQFM